MLFYIKKVHSTQSWKERNFYLFFVFCTLSRSSWERESGRPKIWTNIVYWIKGCTTYI